MKNVNNNIIQALVIVTIFLVVVVGGVVNASALKSEIEVSYQFKTPDITTKDGYAHLRMRDCFSYGAPGMPVLPSKGARILLPYKGKLKNITVIPGNKTTLPGTYKVYPGQRPYPLSYKGKIEFTEPDPEVYGSRTAYPGKFYTYYSVQDKKGYQILILNLQPIEYIPQSGLLSYFDELTVKLSLEQTDKPPLFKGCPDDIEVDNTEVINSYPTGELRDDSVDHYVIITNEELKNIPGPNNFQALRDSKLAKGLNATIVTTEWIYANYDGTRPDGGTDNQTKIRNFIIDYYETHGAPGVDVYVLLGGDGDGADVGGESGDNIIPARGFWSNLTFYHGGVLYNAECYPPNIPADMYYSCLNGTFDYNGNGTYGEPNDGQGGGEVDLYAEVYVGRAPVDSAEEVSNFVRKTLAYESTCDSYLRDVLMAGEFLRPGTWGGDHKDEIKDGSCNHGYCTVGFPPYFDVDTLYDRDWPDFDPDNPWTTGWSNTTIMDKINSGIHIINHAGHANMCCVMKMWSENEFTSYNDVDDLTNNKPFFGYAWGCYAGSFDNRGPPPPDGNCNDLYYDCILEHLVTSEHGAFAFIGNSRYSWAVNGSTDSPSHYYDRQFWDAVFGEGILNLGKANQDSKEDNIGYIGYDDMRWCYYELNLLGDPETSLNVPAHDTDILIVDDDMVQSYEKYYEKYYMNALHANGYNWDCTLPPPDASVLLQYPIVIWLTGKDWTNTLSGTDEGNLQTYLDSGGNLFISGQDIGVDIGHWSSFYTDYLHADYIHDDSNIYTLNGVSGDPIGDGLTIGISEGDGANNQRFPSEIAPYDGNASVVFNYAGDGCGAIKADTGTYRTVYFAFGFEAINNTADRNTVMERVVSWLGIPNASFTYTQSNPDIVISISQPEGAGDWAFANIEGAWQTFKPVSDTITAIDIYTYGSGCDVWVTIEDMNGNTLGTSNHAISKRCDAITCSWTHLDFPAPVRVTPGQTYKIVGYCSPSCDPGASTSSSNPYPDGIFHQYGQDWTNNDLGFQIYSYEYPYTVEFTDTSTDSDGWIEEWYWEFGDGTNSTEQNPAHQYTAFDTYTVTLRVTDNDGATDSVSEDVSVIPLPDLVITDVHADWTEPSWKRYNTIYTVKNVGDVATPHECWTNFTEVNGHWPCSCVDPVPIPVLDVGEEVTHTVGPFVMGGDSDCVEVYADYNNTIVEKNE